MQSFAFSMKTGKFIVLKQERQRNNNHNNEIQSAILFICHENLRHFQHAVYGIHCVDAQQNKIRYDFDLKKRMNFFK